MGWTTFCGWLPSPQQSDSSFLLPLLPAVEREEKMPFSNLLPGAGVVALLAIIVIIDTVLIIGIVDCHYKTRTHIHRYIYMNRDYEYHHYHSTCLPGILWLAQSFSTDVLSAMFLFSQPNQPKKVSAVASGPLPWRFPTGRNGIWRLGCSRSGHRFRVLETHGEK